MVNLPRLPVGYERVPGLFPRYWDQSMSAIEKAFRDIVTVEEIAKDYTDTKTAETLIAANDYTDTETAATLVSAKSYTDRKTYLNVKTDFGAVGDGVTDDTAALQAAINAAQVLKAWLYFPPVQYCYLTTGLTIGLAGTNYTCHFLGGGFDPSFAQSDLTGQFEGMSMIKLIAGSNTNLITVHEDAAQPMFENMVFDGDKTNQTSGTSYPIYLPDSSPSVSPYIKRTGVWMKNCAIRGGRSGGLYVGTARASGYLDNVYIQYNGSATTDAGLVLKTYDWAFQSLLVGSNVGKGAYVSSTQNQFNQCVFWQNNIGVQIGADTSQAIFVNCVFDDSETYGVQITGGDAVYGSITFSACAWQRNSSSANDTYADIYVDSNDRVVLASPTFSGDFGSANRVKYNIEFHNSVRDPRVTMVGESRNVYAENTFSTAFTNNYGYLYSSGHPDSWTRHTETEFQVGCLGTAIPIFRVKSNNSVVLGKDAAYADSVIIGGDGQARAILYDSSETTDEKGWKVEANNGDFFITSVSDDDLSSDLGIKFIRGAGVAILYGELGSPLRLKNYSVASLPSGMPVGSTATATDSSATITAGIGTIVAGGGSNKVPVFYDGTNWRIG